MSKDPLGQTARCFRIIKYLCGHALDGMSNKELAAALRTSPANVCRDMKLLAALGLAEILPSGRYAPTPEPLSWVTLYKAGIGMITARSAEFDRRVEVRAVRLSDELTQLHQE